jgi:hypothetical protein
MPATKKTKGAGGKAGGNALEGITFAISGPLSKPRKHWEDLITSQGGTLAGSVTAAVRLVYLVLAKDVPSRGTGPAKHHLEVPRPFFGRALNGQLALARSNAVLTSIFASQTIGPVLVDY